MKESQNTEWKESWHDEYIKWLCGFANAEGGVLVVGRNDKGQPVGVADAKKLLEDLPNKIRDVLGIMAEVRLVLGKGKDLIEIKVDPYPYPVSYKGQYHVRTGSTKQELKGAALDKFLLSKQGRHWDGVPMPDVTVRSLSKAALDGFRQRAGQGPRMHASDLKESAAGLMEKLHLYDGKYLKRAAVLAFHPVPERFSTGACVKIGYFRSNDELLYQDEIHGDLFGQVRQTMDLLVTKYLKAAITYKGIQRVETIPVPEAALREAVLNSLIHKDYASGAPVQMSVYPDKLTIWNPGQLPSAWTVEKLKKKHASQPFNPDLANIFFCAGEIESWGRGVERIFSACREARCPEPVIEQEPTGLWITFPFSPEVLERIVSPIPSEKTSEKTSEKRLRKTAKAIVDLMIQIPEITTAELAVKLNLTPRAIELQINTLKQDQIIERVGPDRGGHWNVLQ